MPDNPRFSEWELLQSGIIRIHNQEVREYFRDAPDDDLNSPRSTLKIISIVNDRDSALITLLKMFFFWILTKKLHPISPEIYGVPVQEHHESFSFMPQVIIHFQQAYAPTGKRKLTGRVSFRLMKKASEVTQSEVERLAKDIRSEFGGKTAYKWHKGKSSMTYYDKPNGYWLDILCNSKSSAQELVTKLLAINNDTPNWGKSDFKEAVDASKKYPTNTGTTIVLGKSHSNPERRREGDVEITYSELDIWPAAPITLYDRTRKRVGAVLYEDFS